LSTARIAVPDLVSNSYFPAIAAIALDFFKREGLDVVHELIFPNYKAYRWAICALAAQALPGRDVV
jgi:hypothetical protein